MTVETEVADDPVAAIACDPQWLAHRYDPHHDAVHYIAVNRAERRKATFLTDQFLPKDRPPLILERTAAVNAMRSAHAPLHFVFHSAFCCSTLLARAVDKENWSTSLKEPVILNDVVGWRRRGATPEQVRTVLDDALTLLCKSFLTGESVIIKPSNVVNGLAIEMMTLRPTSKALLIYAPLSEFLASIAKKQLDGRLFARDIFLNLLKDGLVRLGFNQDELFRQTDLQIAAMGWLAQLDLFQAMSTRFGPDRVRTLSSDKLLTAPGKTVAALASLFGFGGTPDAIAAVAQGADFTTHSKDGTDFSPAAREAEYAEARLHHHDEIEKVIAWTHVVAGKASIPLDPGSPLIP